METIKNCVYKFIDENGLVIYVGKSKNLKTRLLSHKRSPHLAKSVYAKVRQIEYISYPTYMDAGVMERIFIAHYEPKYNTQFTNEGGTTVLAPAQIDAIQWTLFDKYPDGFQVNEQKVKRMGVLEKADFCLYDGEGLTGEAYFYKISKGSHKLKGIKCIGCLTCLYEDCLTSDLEKYIERQIKHCKDFTAFPMRFLRESDMDKKMDYFRYELKMPFVYTGCGNQLFIGDECTKMRYGYKDREGKTEEIKTLGMATALEIMTQSGEIDEIDYSKYLDVKNIVGSRELSF